MSGYYQYAGQSDGKYTVLHYKDISTALGYQATADKPGTIALGHDKGDTFLTYKWQQKAWKDGNSYYTRNIHTGVFKEISEEEYQKLQNSDGTWNDYTISPNVERGTYDTAYYNRLVKADDGRDAHDVVVMKQLIPYTKSNASNIGANLKTYTVGNDGETITEADASDADKTVNENAWGTAIGNGKIADPTKSDTNDPEANGSLQLVTGGNVYSYNKPVAVPDKTLQYVKEGKTTGENLGILDATLNDKNHNIKYYAVDETTLPKLTNFNGKDYSNEKNDGATGMGSMAAGFNTHADGIASTVAGSYSGVLNQDSKGAFDFRGATALSYGAFNINQNMDTGKIFSGVANSIVGQANATIDSNAAIIYGAGNTVTNSYRKIDDKNASEIKQAAVSAASSKDVKKLGEALQKAVPTSGGQVMVMGGGNNVESAYMTQVVGVGNTVKGNQVQNTKSEWVTDNSIKDYNPEKSSQYNYVDGFSNEVINGKHDYVIGANNKLSGDSYDDGNAQPIKRSNRSNIVIGDNHTLTREQNTIIIGSSDTENTQTKARDAVIIGHNANATNDTGADNAVAIGRSATATGGNAVTIGVNTSAGANSITIGSESSAIPGSNIAIGRYARVYGDNVTNAVALGKLAEAHVADGVAIGSNSIASTGAGKTGYDAQGKTHAATDADYAAWVSTDAAVSVGAAEHEVKYIDKDNKEQSKKVKSTRQITNLAAGTDNTDAVNVAQLKSLQSGLTEDLTNKGLTFATNSGKTTAKLGDTVTIQGTAKKENHEYTADNLTTEIDESGNITILMDKDMSTETLAVNGKDGKDGNPGTAGSIGINGKDGQAGIGIDGKDGISIKGTDGKDGVTIKAVNGKDGTEGHIGLTGPAGTKGMDGADGKPGNSIDITVKNGYNVEGKDGKDGINGENGVDGTNLTRVVYTDGTGEHQIATMEDGLKFKGDDTTVIAKKLNNQLDIIGGADSSKLTNNNIGVNSTTDGKLKVQLADELTGIKSISNQKTVDGTTTGAKITLGDDSTVNVNGGKITNVGSGADADGSYKTTTNAANIGDVQAITETATTGLTNKGLKFAANSGADYTAKLGSKVTIQGTAKKAGHEYTADNLTTEIDESGNITILMDKDMSTETLAVNGKDGKDGNPGTAGSIGINGKDGQAGIGIDGKDGISIKGTDGKDGVTIKAVNGKDGTEGHIGLTGPAGTKGMDGADGKPGNSIDITVKNGYNVEGKDGKDGINGENGVDGTNLTRVVYTDGTGEHQIATMEDGLKFKGDDTTVIAKKLNNTLDIIGGADSKNLTEGNIGVNSTDKGQLKVQLAKDLKGITSISNQNTTKVDGKDVTTGAKIDLGEDGNISVNGGKITNVGSGIEKGTDDKYTVTDANKTNAANIGDVDNMVKQAVDGLSNTTDTKLADKANVNASNVGANISGSDEQKKANEEAWGDALGKGEIKAGEKRLVTGDTVAKAIGDEKTAREAADRAINEKIGTLDKDGNYIKKDDSISKNLSTLDGQVSKISSDVSNLSDNAVQYDKDTNKSKVTLAGEDGTTIDNVKDGTLTENGKEAVNGGQLWKVDQKVENNTTEINKIKNGDFTDASKTAIHNIAKDAVEVVDGTNTTVTKTKGTDTTPTKYAVNVEGNGKVESGNTGLISGGTAYTELRPTDGTYVKQASTTAANLTALDKGLKTTSDLIHTNDKGDTIQIGGNSTATKIDVSGKDGKGNTTGRVITGVVSDANDPNSAAIGYVNGLTAANTQQIYRDMNNAYSRLDTNINRAAAGSNALAALHPLDFDPADKASFAVGYGHYHNANAAAVGAFYQPNANTMVNMGISLGNGDPGFNAGVSFKIGKGSTYNGVSKAEMAQTIHDQAAEISTIKANDAAKDKRIDALEKENQEMKKQIQEILARLNG